MKVLICALQSKYIHSSLAPYYLAAGVDLLCDDNIKLEILEGTINQKDHEIIDKIMLAVPQVLAFSCYIWNISMVKRLVKILAELMPNIKIILGGPEVSFNAEELMAELPQVDYIICGEGEKAFAQLLKLIFVGDSAGKIRGLCYRGKSGEIITNAVTDFEEEAAFGYEEKYLEALGGRIAYLETSRGCPFSCSFCLSGVNHCGVRFFSLDEAKRQLLRLANSGTQTVKLVDRTFNCNPARAYAIFEFLINQADEFPKGICFHFEVAADLFDLRTLELLAEAPKGLFQFEAGLQSFHEQTLEAVHRKTNIEKLTDNLKRLIKNNNIHIHIDLIAGLPFENMACFIQSFERAIALRPHMLQLGFLKLLHGAQIRKQVEEFGYEYSFLPPYEFSHNRFISETEVKRLHGVEDVLDRLYNSGRFSLTLEYLFEVTGETPFEIFSAFSEYLASKYESFSMPLAEYTKAVFEFFCAHRNVKIAALRDVLVMDRLQNENTGKIPSCLRITDGRLKKLANDIKKSKLYEKNKGVKFGIAILYAGGEKVVIADYSEKDLVTGHYLLEVNDI